MPITKLQRTAIYMLANGPKSKTMLYEGLGTFTQAAGNVIESLYHLSVIEIIEVNGVRYYRLTGDKRQPKQE